LRFQLTARDGHGRSTTEDIVIPVTSDPHSLYQELIDESLQGPSPTLKRALKQEFTLRANDAGQQFRISNVSTNGNVSIAGVEVRGPLPSDSVKAIPASDASVQPQGAWKLVTEGGFSSFEDGNENKGKSTLAIPLKVARDGRYRVSLLWRKNSAEGTVDR